MSDKENSKAFKTFSVRVPKNLHEPLVNEVNRRNSAGGMYCSSGGIMREALQEWLAVRGLLPRGAE